MGTGRNLQCGVNATKDAILSFKEEIRRICARYQIEQIFEEMSIDGLVVRNVQSTLCQQLDIAIPVYLGDISAKLKKRTSRFTMAMQLVGYSR